MKPEFDRYAKEYEELIQDPLKVRLSSDPQFFHLRKWILLRRFYERRKIPTGELWWLDVGCGKGDLLNFGRGYFGSLSGCDLSPEMLRHGEGIDIRVQQDARILPFPDASLDLVTAVCVYHHVELADRAALTAEVRRVLKPGGIFAMVEHNPYNPVTAMIVKRSPVDANAHLLTPGLSRSLMSAAGIKPVETTYFLYLPEKLYHRLHLLESLACRIPMGCQYAVFGSRSK